MLVRARAHSRTLPHIPVTLAPGLELKDALYVVDTNDTKIIDGVKAIMSIHTKNDERNGYLPLDVLDLDEAPWDGKPL